MAQLDDKFFTDVLDSNREAVHAAVREALFAGIKREFEWEIPSAVKTAVQDFIHTEIIPEVIAELQANKDVFVTAATDMVKAAPAEIGKAMQQQLAANLTQSWTLRKVMDACFS